MTAANMISVHPNDRDKQVIERACAQYPQVRPVGTQLGSYFDLLPYVTCLLICGKNGNDHRRQLRGYVAVGPIISPMTGSQRL
jgi:hypothetical protein